MVDARTTTRWYLIVAMGRTAGHLALGIGKAAGATLSIIPEEFGDSPIRLGQLVDILAGAIVKRRSHGHEHGTVMLAEGLVEHLAREDLESIGNIERDEHDHPRLSEVNLGDIVKDRLHQRLRRLGIDSTLVTKDIGYELRCADPIPFDMEYTRDLGYCAAEYLLEGGSNAMVTLVDGHFRPLPFDQMLDPRTGRTRVRLVDVGSEHYRIARQYMVRLNVRDFQPESLPSLCEALGVSAEQFRQEFGWVLEHEMRLQQQGALQNTTRLSA
jgi:6-phosphofructokinase 1